MCIRHGGGEALFSASAGAMRGEAAATVKDSSAISFFLHDNEESKASPAVLIRYPIKKG
jgi:hypothetical protein